MSSDVALTSALRNNLLSLQGTQRQMDTTQFRLSTGKKVNSALDNPLNFFRSQSFSNRASDLSSLLDGINLSIRTIEEADKGITAINKLLSTAESIIDEAKSAYNASTTEVARIRGIQSTATTTTVDAATGDALADLIGGIAGFDGAGDSLTITIKADDTTLTATFASTATIQDLIDAFTTGGSLGGGAGQGPYVTASLTNGELLISTTGEGPSGLDSVQFSITDAESDALVNTGGNIIRETSGKSTVYEGIQSTIENAESRYNKILTEISATANDAKFNGINLLKGNDLLTTFNEGGTSTLNTTGDDLTAVGLGLSVADFATSALVTSAADELAEARSTVRSFGNLIATDLSLIQTRRDFTEQTIETLKAGSDDLTLADLNEEGANLLALQTRQSLGVTSLSLASQAQQGVLRLF